MKTTRMKWKISKADQELVEQIVNRAMALAAKFGIGYKRLDAIMDLTACHLNGNPLRLADLLAADEFNFAHDVLGIRQNLNRATGQLGNLFSPRYSDRKKNRS